MFPLCQSSPWDRKLLVTGSLPPSSHPCSPLWARRQRPVNTPHLTKAPGPTHQKAVLVEAGRCPPQHHALFSGSLELGTHMPRGLLGVIAVIGSHIQLMSSQLWLLMFKLKKIFFWCGPFLKSLLNLLQYCFCFMFFVFFGREACGILAPQPGVEHAPPVLEGEVLTTGPPGKSWVLILGTCSHFMTWSGKSVNRKELHKVKGDSH